MGGGLFCLLQMRHQVKDAKKLAQLIMQLNRLEWASEDLTPHFGAVSWPSRHEPCLRFFLTQRTTFNQRYSDKRFTMGMVSGALGKRRLGVPECSRINPNMKFLNLQGC